MAFIHPKILAIASRVRQWAEKKGRELGHPPDMCGMCGVASHRLHAALRKAGFKNSKLVISSGHSFVVVGKDRVVDVTATQFDRYKRALNLNPEYKHPKVTTGLLGARDYWPKPGTIQYGGQVKEFKGPESFIAHQIKQGWPPNQTAHLHSPSFDQMYNDPHFQARLKRIKKNLSLLAEYLS